MKSDRKQIVILGAGYGGLRTAQKLEHLLGRQTEWKITLVDRNNFHQLKSEIHQVAAAKIKPENASIPIAGLIKGKNINFLQAEVTHIDFNQRIVTTSKGKIPYDKLVIALGSETEYFGIPGMSQNSYPLSSLEDAIHIKTHVETMFIQAKNETDKNKRKAMLTIVIGGGGFTGTELATELTDYLPKLSERFNIQPRETQIIIIEAADTVLQGFDTELIRYAEDNMKNERIRLMPKTPCISAEDSIVKLKTGETILSNTIIWTGGIRACDLVAETGLKYGPRSRVIVNPYLESVDHPEVYVVGDNALVLDPVTSRPLAPTAQLALQQADIAAYNVCADVKGTRRIRYIPKIEGQFVSLGGRKAVGWIWKFKVTGFAAWFLKRMTLLRYLFLVGGLRLATFRLPAIFLS